MYRIANEVVVGTQDQIYSGRGLFKPNHPLSKMSLTRRKPTGRVFPLLDFPLNRSRRVAYETGTRGAS